MIKTPFNKKRLLLFFWIFFYFLKKDINWIYVEIIFDNKSIIIDYQADRYIFIYRNDILIQFEYHKSLRQLLY